MAIEFEFLTENFTKQVHYTLCCLDQLIAVMNGSTEEQEKILLSKSKVRRKLGI